MIVNPFGVFFIFSSKFFAILHHPEYRHVAVIWHRQFLTKRNDTRNKHNSQISHSKILLSHCSAVNGAGCTKYYILTTRLNFSCVGTKCVTLRVPAIFVFSIFTFTNKNYISYCFERMGFFQFLWWRWWKVFNHRSFVRAVFVLLMGDICHSGVCGREEQTHFVARKRDI